eukprot:SAG11_NODE_2647_length_3132_cov_3.280910_3_plen_136_part_00
MTASKLQHRFDEDGDGDLTPEQFAAALASIGIAFTSLELSNLVTTIDSDGDGLLSIAELSKRMRRAKRDTAEMVSPAPPSHSGICNTPTCLAKCGNCVQSLEEISAAAGVPLWIKQQNKSNQQSGSSIPASTRGS